MNIWKCLIRKQEKTSACKRFSFGYWNNTENEKKAYQLGLVCKTKREVNELVKRMLDVAKERRK